MKILNLLILASISLLITSCEKDTIDPPPIDEVSILTGPTITFEKADNTNPSEASNQDRITSNVWITRANEGGQIYNAQSENGADKELSPRGTLWAIGSTSNINNLEFRNFRDAVGNPKEVVGKNLVLILVDDKLALDVTFTKWSEGMKGGFAYSRSSQQ